MYLLKFNPVTSYYYFDNIVDQQKANQLNWITIARAMRYISPGVSRYFICKCFSCRLLDLLVETLIDRGDQKILDVLVKYNYLGVSDDSMNIFLSDL